MTFGTLQRSARHVICGN